MTEEVGSCCRYTPGIVGKFVVYVIRQKRLNLSVALIIHCINLQTAFTEQIIDSLDDWSVRAASSFPIRDTSSGHLLPTGGYGLHVYNGKDEVTCHENQSLSTLGRNVVVH